MKGIMLLGAATCLLLSSAAQARMSAQEWGNHSLTLGYSQAKVQDFKNIYGANAKYRYEWTDSPWGVITSFTYMGGTKGYREVSGRNILQEHAKINYYSLSAGPTYRFNDVVSVYGVLGMNISKVDSSYYRQRDQNSPQVITTRSNSNKTKGAFMYGAGIQINPWENLAIDIGYEGSRVDINGKERTINGFNIGILAIVF